VSLLDAKQPLSLTRSRGVPGELRGLQYIHQYFGSMNWEDLITPAVKLARDGFPLYSDINDQITYLDSPEFLV
jgi:gamma-glutamyltranspeptidase/glutathione hydrolase